MKTILRISSVLILLMTLNACAGGVGRPADARPVSELMGSKSGQDADYMVTAGDTLDVKVWGEPTVSGQVFVRDDGKFTLPLAGDIIAEGKTLKGVTADITEKLRKFIPAASVSVSVLQAAPVRYFLSGKFIKPGEFRSVGQISLLQAIATGGGFAPFADDSSIILVRKSPEGDRRYQLNYSQIIQGRQPNPQLLNGDIVHVE